MSSATLPPIALEAVLKLLAVGQSSARGEFAAAIPAEKPALRLDGAAQAPALPAWPNGRLELPRGVPGRPPRRAPGRGKASPYRDPRPLMGEE